jgi:hypothetical protein
MYRLLLVAAIGCSHPSRPASDRVALRIDTTEARAVLAMISAPSSAAWDRLVATDGYRRLRIREQAMHRTFEDADVRAFVATPQLAARAPALGDAVARWSAVDLDAIAERVLGYLPREAKLAATVYPVIKPRPNSFVNFDDAGAAIFVSIDPAQTTAQLDNTIAHELHHIGFASVHDAPCAAAPSVCAARTWTGAFGEGFAMLAAAGGPDIHPHRASSREDRERWDRDVARFDDDLLKLEAFFRDVLAGHLDDNEARERASEFYGVQGAWYTVGWVMAASVERCFGRAALVDAMRQPWTVLALYNDARSECPTKTGPATATWDAELVAAMR